MLLLYYSLLAIFGMIEYNLSKMTIDALKVKLMITKYNYKIFTDSTQLPYKLILEIQVSRKPKADRSQKIFIVSEK